MPGVYKGAGAASAIYFGDAEVHKVFKGALQAWPVGGGGGGSEPHRYWRVSQAYSTVGFVSAGELWFQAGGVDIGPPTAYLASNEYDGGSTGAKAYDGTAATRWMTSGQDGTSSLAFDYGVDVTPDSIRLVAASADVANRTIRGCIIEHSDAGLSGPWTRYARVFFGRDWGAGDTRIRSIVPPAPVTGGKRFWALRDMASPGGLISIADIWFSSGGVEIPLQDFSASAPYDGGSTADLALDHDLSSRYMTSGGAGKFFMLDYLVPVNPDEVTIRSPNFDVPNRTVNSAFISYSDDGLTWTNIATLALPAFGFGETKTFSFTPLV